MTFEEFDDVDIEMSELEFNEVGLLQYLYYDFKMDLSEEMVNNPYYGDAFKDVEKNIKELAKKYNFELEFISKAFSKDFTDWNDFYSELERFFNVLLEKIKK